MLEVLLGRPDRHRLLRRIGGRLRQAPGTHDRTTGDLPGPATDQRRRRRGRGRVDRDDPRHRVDEPAVDPARARFRARRHLRAADRWRRRPGVDLAAQRLHRSRGRGLGLHARLEPVDRRRHARRRLGYLAHAPHEQGHGSQPLQRALLGLRLGRDRQRRDDPRRRTQRAFRHARGHRHPAGLLLARRDHPRLRTRRRPGPARAARTGRAVGVQGHRGLLRHPPGRRSHARVT